MREGRTGRFTFSALAGIVALVAAVAAGCDDRAPEEGHYRFDGDQIFTDTCGFAAPPDTLWDGSFSREGSLITIPLDLNNLRLRGGYLYQSTRFAVDGTAEQVATRVAGAACLVDWIGVHLEGEAQTQQHFSGAVQITYYALSSDACSCTLQGTYQATWESPP